LIAVGNGVRLRADGGSAAARKYGGREGVGNGDHAKSGQGKFFVRIEASGDFETAFGKRDLVRLGDDEEGWHLGTGEGNRLPHTD
jgi:hypothetical protein